MMQKGPIKKEVLESLGLDVGIVNKNITPVKGKPFVKHVQGEPVSGNFNYSSMVGMFLSC